jgi:pimeloyl-ACP methyl ester carboxylesterase
MGESNDMTVDDWEAMGERRALGGHQIFTLDLPATGDEAGPPLLVLHGFPTCTYDWRHVLPALRRGRRVIALDMLGYGMSAKPDQRYSLFEQADIAVELVDGLGVREIDLVTHDMGDTVGGELLARDLDGALPFRVRKRVITNGSIYIEMAHLTIGQQLLLSLPDEQLPLNPDERGDGFRAGLALTFAPTTPASAAELDAQWQLVAREGGNRLMPRLIRYIEERREHQPRWTGAIETHPSPLRIVWADQDPVAVWPMAERLSDAVPSAPMTRLDGIGHWPMIEDPARFGAEVLAGLS